MNADVSQAALLELQYSLDRLQNELGRLRSLLCPPAQSAPVNSSYVVGRRRKLEHLEDYDAATRSVITSKVDPARRSKRLYAPTLFRDECIDGICALPPEIWTYILRYLICEHKHAQGKAALSPLQQPSPASEEQQERGSEEDEDHCGNEDGAVVLTTASQASLQQSGTEASCDCVTENPFSGPLGAATLVCRTWRKVPFSSLQLALFSVMLSFPYCLSSVCL